MQVKIVINISSEYMEKLKYLGRTVKNYIHEETESGLNSGNAFFCSVQKLLSSISRKETGRLKYKKLKFHPMFYVSVKLGLSL